MLLYLVMICGFAALLAMMASQMKYATPARFLVSGVAVAAVWFTLCLVCSYV